MAYTDFTLDLVESQLGVPQRLAPLFGPLAAPAVPSWLPDHLARGLELSLLSEKARSEFLVAPILLAVRELSGRRVSILSGQRLDVDDRQRLNGECDFILSLSDPLPRLRGPIVTVLEAKKGDIDAGLGQCAAQMVAARLFNANTAHADRPVFGCVTSGGEWQFLRLDDTGLVIDSQRRYIDRLETVLAALLACVGGPPAGVP